jgi:AcrR family transcriptional regulator
MPRAGLSRERVVEEATVMADEVGLNQLNLTALAERLGVRQPSLYKHIDSMAGLHRGIAIASKNELGDVLGRAAVGRSGADAITAMSAAYRSWALLHPARYQASMAMPGPDDEEQNAAALAAVQVIADVLIAYNLQGDDAIDAIRAFRSTLHGFILLESQGGFALAVDTQRSFDRMIRGFVFALEHWTP